MSSGFAAFPDNQQPSAALLSPTGSFIQAQGKTAPAVAALGQVLKNTSQAEGLPDRPAGKLAMNEAGFQPAIVVPSFPQGCPRPVGVALG
jgi:hypothetical protein